MVFVRFKSIIATHASLGHDLLHHKDKVKSAGAV